MAAITLLGSATFSTANGTKTVTATPAVGDLILIVTAHTGNTSSSAPTDDQGGTYTLITSALKASSADVMRVWARTALVASSVSTVYTHAPGTTTGGGLAVLKATGMSRAGADAVRQSAAQENQAAAGTPTPVFGLAALTANAVFGAVFNATNPAGMTPRSSPAYTERADVGYNTPASGLEVMSIDSGETATSIAWGGTSASAFGAVVVELDTSVPPALVPDDEWTHWENELGDEEPAPIDGETDASVGPAQEWPPEDVWQHWDDGLGLPSTITSGGQQQDASQDAPAAEDSWAHWDDAFGDAPPITLSSQQQDQTDTAQPLHDVWGWFDHDAEPEHHDWSWHTAADEGPAPEPANPQDLWGDEELAEDGWLVAADASPVVDDGAAPAASQPAADDDWVWDDPLGGSLPFSFGHQQQDAAPSESSPAVDAWGWFDELGADEPPSHDHTQSVAEGSLPPPETLPSSEEWAWESDDLELVAFSSGGQQSDAAATPSLAPIADGWVDDSDDEDYELWIEDYANVDDSPPEPLWLVDEAHDDWWELLDWSVAGDDGVLPPPDPQSSLDGWIWDSDDLLALVTISSGGQQSDQASIQQEAIADGWVDESDDEDWELWVEDYANSEPLVGGDEPRPIEDDWDWQCDPGGPGDDEPFAWQWGALVVADGVPELDRLDDSGWLWFAVEEQESFAWIDESAFEVGPIPSSDQQGPDGDWLLLDGVGAAEEDGEGWGSDAPVQADSVVAPPQPSQDDEALVAAFFDSSSEDDLNSFTPPSASPPVQQLVERVLTVQAEQRVLTVAGENRTLAVSAEERGG